MRVVAAPDKFRGTATAADVAVAIGHAAEALGWTCDEVPLADGGEGTLDVLGGPNRTTVVTGPLGKPVEAGWRLAGGTAVIEMARASGLELAGGAEGNDPVDASTIGTGELIATAIESGATRVDRRGRRIGDDRWRSRCPARALALRPAQSGRRGRRLRRPHLVC